MTRTRLWRIGAGIGIFTFAFRLLNVRDLPNDHYMHLAWAQQLLFGELPGRDFVDPGMPLTYILSALVQLVSPGPFSEVVLCCVMLAVAAAVTFVVAVDLTDRRVRHARAAEAWRNPAYVRGAGPAEASRNPDDVRGAGPAEDRIQPEADPPTSTSIAAGLGAAFVEIALYPRLYSYPKILVPAVALLTVVRYVRVHSAFNLVLMAIWTAVAVLLRHDLGIYTAAGVATALLVTHWRDWRALQRAAAVYAAAVVIVMLPYVVYVQWSEGLAEHFHEALEFARGEAHQRFLAPPAFPYFSGDAVWSSVDSATLLFYVAHLLAIGALVLLVRSRNAAAAAALSMLALYLVVVLRHPIVSRIQDVAALLAIVGAWQVVESRRQNVLAFAAVAAVAAISVAAIWQLGDLGERMKDTRVADGLGTMRRTIEGVKETGTQWPWERYWPAGELPEAVRYLNACTRPDEAVLLTWAAPEYYFFARRRFAAGHALFLPPDAFTTPHDQERMLARLRRQNVPIVLINETRRMEFISAYGKVDRYLQEEYVAAGQFRIREGSDVTIAMRRNLVPQRTYGDARWPCGLASRAASRTASIMLDGSATPLPAMSNAVP